MSGAGDGFGKSSLLVRDRNLKLGMLGHDGRSLVDWVLPGVKSGGVDVDFSGGCVGGVGCSAACVEVKNRGI